MIWEESASVSRKKFKWKTGQAHFPSVVTVGLFLSLQTVGATDWETFQIDGRFFLAVANSQKVAQHGPSLYTINSTVYELNTLTQTFIRFQDILTHRWPTRWSQRKTLELPFNETVIMMLLLLLLLLCSVRWTGSSSPSERRSSWLWPTLMTAARTFWTVSSTGVYVLSYRVC